MSHISRLALAGLLMMAAGCDQGDGETVGPRGATIVSPDGRLTLEIPEGALDIDVEISIEEIDAAPEDAIGPSYEVEPRGLPFRIPATLTYVCDVHEDAVGPEDLMIVVEKEDHWNTLADREVEAETVSASAGFVSSFAIVTKDKS